MKRIVQCPKCEAKLSVFDSGKPISQKCPKCANTFEVTSEGAVEPPAAETPTAPPEKPLTEKEKTASAPSSSAPKPPEPVAPTVSAEPVIVESGISFLHVMVIFALLFIIIVVQVWTFKMTERRLDTISSNIQTLSKNATRNQ